MTKSKIRSKLRSDLGAEGVSPTVLLDAAGAVSGDFESGPARDLQSLQIVRLHADVRDLIIAMCG